MSESLVESNSESASSNCFDLPYCFQGWGKGAKEKSTREHRLNHAYLDGVDLSPNQEIQNEKVRVERYLGNYLLLRPVMAQQSPAANYEYHDQHHASAAACCP
jgi:hypothetical protein